MPIKLLTNYQIERDSHNWILQSITYTDPTHRFATHSTPQKKIKDIGYFKDIYSLASYLVNKELLLADDVYTLRDILEGLKRMENLIKIEVEERNLDE